MWFSFVDYGSGLVLVLMDCSEGIVYDDVRFGGVVPPAASDQIGCKYFLPVGFTAHYLKLYIHNVSDIQ
jgi:hypothetical protein